MKRMLWTLGVVFCLVSDLSAQEMIVNGGFDSDQGWTLYDLDSSTPVSVDFGIDDNNGPEFGTGPYLEVYIEHDQYVNCLVWQTLTLEAGATYILSGAFKDLTGGALFQFWSQMYLSLEEPVEGSDYVPPAGGGTDDRMSFNTWDGCGIGVDGTWQDDACGPDHFNTYVPPGEAGTEVTVYFGIKTGFWVENRMTLMDVAIDNVSLVKEGTGVAHQDKRPVCFMLHPACPNPFNPSTLLRFSLTQTGDTRLAVYNVNGGLVKNLMQQSLNAGSYTVMWDGTDAGGMLLPSGMYFCRLQSGSQLETQRVILQK